MIPTQVNKTGVGGAAQLGEARVNVYTNNLGMHDQGGKSKND